MLPGAHQEVLRTLGVRGHRSRRPQPSPVQAHALLRLNVAVAGVRELLPLYRRSEIAQTVNILHNLIRVFQ